MSAELLAAAAKLVHEDYMATRRGLHEACRDALDAGVTCQQLGERLGVHASTVHRWAKKAS